MFTMRALSARQILDICEAGWHQHPLDRALTVLSVALGRAPGELASLTVGQRDALLLSAREATFGPALDGYADCAGCGQPLEFTLPVASARVAVPPEAGAPAHELTADGVTIRFRLPDSRDLAAVTECADVRQARRLLVERCVLAVAGGDGAPTASAPSPADRSVPAALSPAVVSVLAERMNELDPQAEVLLDLRCPACGHAGRPVLDIAEYFWAELAVQAKRLLREVHALAHAYAWRETDILAMSAWRRRCYLEMAGA